MTRNLREEMQHRGELGTRAIQSAQRQAMRVDFALRASRKQLQWSEISRYKDNKASLINVMGSPRTVDRAKLSFKLRDLVKQLLSLG